VKIGFAASRLSLVFALVVTTGCSAVLPKEDLVTRQPWKSFDETEQCFNRIVPHQTTVADLGTMGLDPHTSANLRILNYVELIARFLPHNGITKDDLHADLQKCLAVKDACQAYEMKAEQRYSKREGNVLLDVFGFKRTTHVTGWSFVALLVLDGDTVVYKIRGGEPHVDRTEKRVRPLGPLQDLDRILVPMAGRAI
jgi:hypothetical protein